MPKKAILLLDIDGVLAPWNSGLGFDQDVFWFHEGANVYLHRELPKQVARMMAVAELQWGTAWERNANTHILEHMGLTTPLPYIEFSNYKDLDGTVEAVEEEDGIYHRWTGDKMPDTWKLPWIERFCHANADRAIAWIDDEIHDDAQEYAAAREAPTLFLRTAGHIGLTDGEIEAIETWVEQDVAPWLKETSEVS